MRHLRIVIPASLAVVLSAYAGYRMLASDETRIHWLLDDTATAFNDTDLSGVLEAFAPDWKDDSGKVDRPMLTNALRFVFLRRIDPKTKRFSFRVRLPAADRTITVDEGHEQARIGFDVHLERRAGDDWVDEWHIRMAAQLGRVDGDWRFVGSSYDTVSGDIPR